LLHFLIDRYAEIASARLDVFLSSIEAHAFPAIPFGGGGRALVIAEQRRRHL
jgi:hypothetical protein